MNACKDSTCNCKDHNPHNPGKFEGEPAYVVHYWNLAMQGFYDDDDGEEYTFYLDEQDYKIFPELTRYTVLFLRESNDGFIYSDLGM